ncbi:MAG: alpha/beta hydrolase [Patescibacteria group bacterium]
MKQQVVVIHGGNAYDSYEEYLNDLKNRELDLEKLKRKGWKASLPEALGERYEILALRMPCPDNAKYSEWKILFEKLFPFLQENVIFVGHSLGGIFLVKFFSEEILPKKARAVFLVAAPHNTVMEHPLADFILKGDLSGLSDQSREIYLYHSQDDEVVPFSSFESFVRAFPEAKQSVFVNRGHFNQDEFPEIVEDITSLA